jgi:hypothetical protein
MDTMSSLNGDSQSSLAMMIHEFVFQRSPATRAENLDYEDDDESDHYEVEQGENWLRLLHKEGHSILDNTQDMSQQSPLYPSIVSLSSVGFLDAPSTDCYICVDLDGDTLAIKDMRLSENREDDDEDDDPKASNQLGIARKGETGWEVLPRRQLRIIHLGDRLCTSLISGMPEGLIFEYTISAKKQHAVFCAENEETPMSREGLGMLTQPQDDMSEEMDTQTEPTPVKSDLVTELVALNDNNSKASDYDSDKTVDIMTQNSYGVSSIQVSSSVVLCTQPKEDCSDDETTLGDHDNHHERSSAPQHEEAKFPCNDGESSKDDSKHPDRREPRDSSVDDANLQDKSKVDNVTDQTMGQKEDMKEETSYHQESTAEAKEGKDGVQPTHETSVDAADGGTQGGTSPRSSNNDVVEGIDDVTVKNDVEKECETSAKEDTTQRETRITMSPSLCGETEDPPGPHNKTPANDTEPENEKASQSSDAISLSLLCETGEQMPEKESQDLLSSAANDDKRGKVGEATGSKDKESAPSGSNPPRHDESTKIIESQDLGDDGDDRNFLQENDDDSATQVSCVLPSNVGDKPDEQEAHNEEGDTVSKQPEDSPRTGCGADQKETKEEEAKKNDRSQEMESTPERVSGVRSDNKSEKNNEKRNGDEGAIDEQRPSASKRPKRDNSSSKSPASKRSKRPASPLESTNESTANRKRTRLSPSAKSTTGENLPQTRVMTTGIELTNDQKHVSETLRGVQNSHYLPFSSFAFAIIFRTVLPTLQMVKRIGGILLEKVEDAASATYVIAGSKGTSLRRTPKLMIGLCRTSNIVELEWLLQSAKDRKPLPSKKFLLVSDGVAETQYNFNMRETLMRAGKMRSNGKSLLGAYSIFVCTGVAGNKSKDNRTPPLEEFRLILEAAGATWISSLPNSTKSSSISSKVILLVSKVDREAKKQLSLKKVAEAVKKGAISKTTEEVFHGIMTQKFKL